LKDSEASRLDRQVAEEKKKSDDRHAAEMEK
jgi:hypothetical protein